MVGFVEGVGRGQTSLFPAQLDDYVAEDNPVRAVDTFVDGLELGKLGFVVEPEATGRPGYHTSGWVPANSRLSRSARSIWSVRSLTRRRSRYERA